MAWIPIAGQRARAHHRDLPGSGCATDRTQQLEQRRADRAREVKPEARTKLEKTLLYLDLDEHCDCCTE